jgi:hypothetical protein
VSGEQRVNLPDSALAVTKSTGTSSGMRAVHPAPRCLLKNGDALAVF